MTITVQHNRVVATGNGATTIWPADFSAMDEADVNVYLYEIATETLTLLSDAVYTLSGIPGNTFSVTYPLVGAPLASTHKIIIERIVPLLQPASFSNSAGFDPVTLTLQLDDMVRQIQQVNDGMQRSVKVDVSGTQTPEELLEALFAIEGNTEAAAAAAAASAAAAAASETDAQTAQAAAEASAAEAAASAASINPANLVHITDTNASSWAFVNETGPLAASGTTLAVESVIKSYIDTATDALGIGKRLGIVSPIPADMNAVEENGWYHSSAATINQPTVGGLYYIWHNSYDNPVTHAIQIAYPLSSAAGGFIRYKVTSVWGAWARISLGMDVVNTWQAAQASATVALTDGATITPNLNLSNKFSVTLAGNRTMANPSAKTVGTAIAIFIRQDATGSRTLSWGTQYKWPGGVAPVLSTTANAIDMVAGEVVSTTEILCNIAKGFA